MIKNYFLISFFCCFISHSQSNKLFDKTNMDNNAHKSFSFFSKKEKNGKLEQLETKTLNNVPKENLYFYSNINAQKNSKTTPTANWIPIIPTSFNYTDSWTPGKGRVNTVYKLPNNSSTIYVGTPSGGLWKSEDSGTNWVPLSDFLPQIGISGILVDPNNTNTIYVATGDRDGNDSYSVGIMKTTDGGNTWNATGLTFTDTISRVGDMLMHPNNSQLIICATSEGIYRTIDGGDTWNLSQAGDFSQGSLRFRPNIPSIVYCVSNDKFFRSTNTGSSFANITPGLPTTSSRMVLDVTPANSFYVYVLSTDISGNFQGLYRSTDGGSTFTLRNGSTDVIESSDPLKSLSLAISKTNANEVYTGCLNIWKSTDGGTTLNKINDWNNPSQSTYTHGNIHYLATFDSEIYSCSGGGIFMSNNNGSSFSNITSNAQIGQYYTISISEQNSQIMMGGLHGNGGAVYNMNNWNNFFGENGTETAINPLNQNISYGFSSYGTHLYITDNSGINLTETVNSPGGFQGNYKTPLVINKIGELYSGFELLYRLSGNTWVQHNVSDLGTGNIDLIKIDPFNNDIIYLSKDSKLYKSSDHGLNFSIVYIAPNNISSIEVNKNNSNIIYLTVTGLTGEILKSNDGGNTFIEITNGLTNTYKNILVHQGNHPLNPLFLGTNNGVYYLDDDQSTWLPFNDNLPNVKITDIEICATNNELIAATFGRGIWKTDIPEISTNNDVKLITLNAPSSEISCNNNVVTPEISFENNGTDLLNSVSINYGILPDLDYNHTWNGSLAYGESTTITLPSISLPKGVHQFQAIVNTTNDAFYNNNHLSKLIFINDNGVFNVVNHFSSSSDELLTYNENLTSPEWVRGIRTGGLLDSGGNYVYTTNLSGNYSNQKKSYLISQCYDLSLINNPQINFDMKYDLEENFDIVYVEYTTDSGTTWNILGEMGPNWYNSDRTNASSGAANDCQNCPGAQWTGSNTNNTNYFYSLASLTGQTNVVFRIVFHSNQFVNKEGINIDNFVITGTLANEEFENQEFVLYPNPSNGNLNLKMNEVSPVEITLFDNLGKKIFSNYYNPDNPYLKFDFNYLENGIYFIQIKSNQNNIIKKFIKN